LISGNSPIHWSARNGHLDCIIELLKAKPVLNQQNKLGDTPLHCAAWGGNAEIAKLLLEHGVDPNVLNKEGQSALDLAKNDETAAVIMEYLEDYADEEYEGVDTDEEDDE